MNHYTQVSPGSKMYYSQIHPSHLMQKSVIKLSTLEFMESSSHCNFKSYSLIYYQYYYLVQIQIVIL